MSPEQKGRLRLKGLLEKKTWSRQQAIFIVAGLDPATEWANQDAPQRWLLNGLPSEWQDLSPNQVQRRAERAVMVAEFKLIGLPSPMTPFAWLCETVRRKTVQLNTEETPYLHPGITPSWLLQARKHADLVLLVPPEFYPQAHRAKMKHAGQPSASLRIDVRRMWDEMNLGEKEYLSKAEFIKAALAALDERTADAETSGGLVREWIDEWERELFSPYGVIEITKDTFVRAYGHPTIMRPVKKK